MSLLQDTDFVLPEFRIYDITTDHISMDVGGTSIEDVTDREAMSVLYKLRRIYASRLKHIVRELERFEALNEPTEYTEKEITESLARAERWRRQDYPRELEIALHKNGIKAL